MKDNIIPAIDYGDVRIVSNSKSEFMLACDVVKIENPFSAKWFSSIWHKFDKIEDNEKAMDVANVLDEYKFIYDFTQHTGYE